MRPSLLLLASAASCVSATKIGCPQHLFEELVARTSCGDNKSISKCLTSDIDLARLDEIEQCYIAGGCSKADATVGAVWFAHEYRTELREEDERQELRRRADSSSSDSATETTSEKTTEKTTSKATAKSTTAETTESSAAASSTSAPSSAAASTTSDSTTSDSTTSTTATTASSTTSSTSKTSSSSSTSTGKVTTTGTLLCSTTSTVQTSYCLVTSGTTGSCVATTSLVSTCAAGNLCMTNSAGEDTCMKIDNHVGVGGIIIAIVFGSAIAAVAVGIIIMNHKANAAQKRREVQAAAFVYKGKGADVEAPSEANLPLIQEPGAPGYGGQEILEHGRRAPQLHQGLGALS